MRETELSGRRVGRGRRRVGRGRRRVGHNRASIVPSPPPQLMLLAVQMTIDMVEEKDPSLE